jgi:hypothetical protein
MKNPYPQRWTVMLCAFALVAATSYAAAQSKTAPPAKPAPASAAPASPANASMHSCPMEEAGPIADVQVENTADGAVIRLKAKSQGDVERIQRMAAMMAKHMSGEPMKGMHDGMQHGGMQHGGMHHGPEGSAGPSAPKSSSSHVH